MTIFTLKQNFKKIGKINLSPKVSNYNPAIIASFNKTAIPPASQPIDNKITFSPTVQTPTTTNIFQQLNNSGVGVNLQNLLPTINSPIIQIPLPEIVSQTNNPTTIVPHINPTPATVPPTTSIGAPSLSPNAENFTGEQLSTEEKPSITSIFSVNIVDGIPQKNLIFIKKLNSKTKKAIKYSILKKNLFKNTNFDKIFEAAPEQMPLASQYAILQSNNDIQATYAVEDLNIEKNNVYVYKLYVEWADKTQDEIERDERPIFNALLNQPLPISGIRL